MRDWNVVVSVHDGQFARACQILAQFGRVERTEYYNVLVMRVANRGEFLDALANLAATVPDILGVISRAVPTAKTFSFQEAGEFEAKAGASLFHITLVHFENGVPVQREDRHVNALAAPQFMSQDFAVTTPTAYLMANVPVDELEHTVEAILPSADEQRLLDVPAGEPCLTLTRRSWSRNRVVTVVRFTYPASRHALYSRYRPSAGNLNLEASGT